MKKQNSPQLRQEIITRLVMDKGWVSVDDLVEMLGVSRMTVHRDLDELEDAGVLRKVRNGASVQPSSLFESDYRYRVTQQSAEKRAICEKAASFIEPGTSIMLDDSTTVLPLVEFFPQIESLTVITHFLPVMQHLATQRNVHLISLGGEYLPQFETFTGILCQQAIASLRADACFLSASACVAGDLYHPETELIHMKRSMMQQCTRKYLLLDHSKFGRIALHRLAALSEFNCVITDSKIDPGHLKMLEEHARKVEVVG
jgi:DeoR/GlpR family transcriptional regulator of sugar metabolism